MFHKFTNDYSELCPIEIIEALKSCLDEQNSGYGLDVHSENAKKLILERFNINNGDVAFLSGGTQSNMAVISYLLKPYEGVISSDTGHINVHETASVEGSGHKIYTVKNNFGKILPNDIEKAVNINNNEHMVKLKMVYISNATETGTIFNLVELKAIRRVCDKYGLYLFIDGARLATALTSKKNDVKCSDIGEIADVFYIGGTKNGMLSGEAVCFKNKDLANEFRYHIKNKGAMLAKGFVLGIQFERMFTDNLYFDLGKKTNEIALYLKEELKKIVQVSDSDTNQLFVTLPKDKALDIIDKFGCELWTDLEDNLEIRFVTSFRTKKEDVDELIKYLKKII